MSNPVAAGISRISLLNLDDDETVNTQIVLEVYDGDHRIQVEFDDLDEFHDVVDKKPEPMIQYFRDNLFDSPEMDDPREALLSMAETSGDEGLVTVPPEMDDPVLFDAMTEIFQKTIDYTQEHDDSKAKQNGDFIQSLVRDQEDEESD